MIELHVLGFELKRRAGAADRLDLHVVDPCMFTRVGFARDANDRAGREVHIFDCMHREGLCIGLSAAEILISLPFCDDIIGFARVPVICLVPMFLLHFLNHFGQAFAGIR